MQYTLHQNIPAITATTTTDELAAIRQTAREEAEQIIARMRADDRLVLVTTYFLFSGKISLTYLREADGTQTSLHWMVDHYLFTVIAPRLEWRPSQYPDRNELCRVLARITHEDADAIVQASAYADLVEESETTEAGYVYTLSDGSAVVVGFDGQLTGPVTE